MTRMFVRLAASAAIIFTVYPAAAEVTCARRVSEPPVYGWRGQLGTDWTFSVTNRLPRGHMAGYLLAGDLWTSGRQTKSGWVYVNERDWQCTPDIRSFPMPPAQDPKDEYLGAMRWIDPAFPLRLCDKPDDMLLCLRRVKQGAFIVTDRVDRIVGNAAEGLSTRYTIAYKVQFADGSTGYATPISLAWTNDARGIHAMLSAEAECHRRGGIQIGMTKEQVYGSCWGRPQSINSTVTAVGTHEQLVYGSGAYVYLDNGMVTAVQTQARQ